MSNKLQAFKITQELMKHKEELLKYPDSFKTILEDLRKAVRDEDEFGDGYSIVDDPNADMEGDDADKWLKEQESKKPEASKDQEVPQKQYMKNWEPQSDYSPEQKAAIDQHMKNGYSHREAERLANAHKGPSDFISAMRSGVAPSMMSDKMLADLKPLSKLWLDEADKKEKLSANPETNPMKHAAGKMIEAHEKSNANYNKAYNEFLSSDAVKGLKGKERHQKIQSWKADWKKENPEHEAGLQDVSSAQKTYGESKEAAKQSLQEKMNHIMSGGQSMPTEMTSNEALQHLGGGKSDEGYQGSIVQDPSASFAARNPKLLASLKPEQQERLNRVNSAAKAQGVIRRRVEK